MVTNKSVRPRSKSEKKRKLKIKPLGKKFEDHREGIDLPLTVGPHFINASPDPVFD